MQREQAGSPSGPRRSALAQDRSKATRRRLVRAALDLWGQRGFDTGVEDTTVDEIVRAAGVTKGTFYFHFAHKEDILLELGWGTAEALYDEAVAGLEAQRGGLALVDDLIGSLARRAVTVPPAAVLRAVTSFYSYGAPRVAPGRREIAEAFTLAFAAARQQGELPEDTDPVELGRVLATVAMDALLRWARGDQRPLLSVLRTRGAIVVAGARAERDARCASR